MVSLKRKLLIGGEFENKFSKSNHFFADKLLENGTKRNTEKDWLYYGRNKGFAKWSKY